MLYRLLKFPAQIALPFYCKKLQINHPEFLHFKGPLLIAANHPNSFLDAIVLASVFQHPIHSLVRGDVYINKFYSSLLNSLNMLPVYRISEGAENLNANYDTFERCKQVFKDNGIVLIFSEGRCINEWKLRPLKKGTARLAMSAWEANIPLQILPVGINFSSFKSFGKIIHINFGKPFGSEVFQNETAGRAIGLFNHQLEQELLQQVYKIEEKDTSTIKETFNYHISPSSKILLVFPAVIGWLITAPLYYPLRCITKRKWNNDHFDSIMVAGIFVGFPIYVLLITIIMFFAFHSWWILLFPFFAIIGAKSLLSFTFTKWYHQKN